MTCRSLLQGIFQTQGENPSLSHCRQILYHLSHQQSPLRLNELLGWNTDSIDLVSSSEFSLCLCVFYSLSLPHPPPCVRMHGESSLGRNNSHQNFTLLAPLSGTSSPQNCENYFCCLFYCLNKFLLFISLSLLYSFWHSWLTNTKSFILEIYKRKGMKGN